jgi:hypothetical protein
LYSEKVFQTKRTFATKEIEWENKIIGDMEKEDASEGHGAEAPVSVTVREWRHETLGYVLTDDPERVDLDTLHRFLSTEAYWSVDISKERVALAVRLTPPPHLPIIY